MVVSQNFSAATSLAMLAPISTLMSIPIFSLIMSEMSFSPSGPSSMPWKDSESGGTAKSEGQDALPGHRTHACNPTTPIIHLRQEDCTEFTASLGHIESWKSE